MRRVYPVFISHSSSDDDFVESLAIALAENGIGAWKDDSIIRVGEIWKNPAEKGIRECKVFILVISPESLRSSAVKEEIAWAEKYHRPLIPILLKSPESWDGYRFDGIKLNDYTYADCREWANTETIDDAVLRRLIDGINSYRMTWYAEFINSTSFSDEEEASRVEAIRDLVLQLGDRSLPQLAERVFRGLMSPFPPPESEAVFRAIAEIGGDFAIGILHLALEAYDPRHLNTPIIIEALGRVGDHTTENILYTKLVLYQRFHPQLVDITNRAINEARRRARLNNPIEPNTTLEDLVPFMDDE